MMCYIFNSLIKLCNLKKFQKIIENKELLNLKNYLNIFFSPKIKKKPINKIDILIFNGKFTEIF